MKKILTTGIFCTFTLAFALEYIPGKADFTLKTKTLEATVKDGMVIGLKDLRSGKLWADASQEDTASIPVGLGILNDIGNFRTGHIPWGEPTLNQHLKPGIPLRNNFRSGPNSKYTVAKNGDTVTATWKGLSNGEKYLKDAELTFTFTEAPDGALNIRTSGRNPGGNVFGAELPLVNLDNRSEIIVPGFGGIGYKEDGMRGLMPFGGAPFQEAPLIMAQDRGKSLALWMEDPTMRSLYTFLNRSGRTMALVFENLNLMPFEDKKEFQSPVLKLNVFQGDWKAAATPYRNWYQAHFKNDIAIRDGVKWADDIKAIFDIYMTIPDDKVLAGIAKEFPAESVMFQIWNARKPNFDTELPDWTPRKGYVEGVERLHKHGFKAMAYVNTYCANYMSPVWKRDNLSSFFLTRKNSLSAYNGQSISDTTSTINEKLIGTVDYSVNAKDQFKNIPPGRLLYVDPLSPHWKTYHADMMKWWNTTTKTDANYEDTAGSVTDGGNGVVNNLSAGEGSVVTIRELQKIQPHIPMASEYGPAGIAFAMKWALNYAGAWGYDGFKKYRIHNQYPVESYLYGYRQWVPGLLGDRDLICHTMAAVSDATGGLGFSLLSAPLGSDPKSFQDNYTFRRHFYERSKVFITYQLLPWFPEGNYPENIRCMYRGKNGIYSYYDDGGLQQMLAPDGKPLYGRVYGASRVRTSLWLNQWPMQNGHEIFGLDPEKCYPLFVKPKHAKETLITVNNLPEKVYAKKYQETQDAALLELIALPGGPSEAAFSLKHAAGLTRFYVNDQEVDPSAVKSALPLRLTAVKELPVKSGEFIGNASTAANEAVRGVLLYRLNSGFRAYPVKVDSKDAALNFHFRNVQSKYPWHNCDGTIVRLLINGRLIGEYDCLRPGKEKRKMSMDTKLHRWTVPLGSYAGKTVLVTVEVDMKTNANWDNQLISVPKLIHDPEQKFKKQAFDGSFKFVKNIGKPQKWHGGAVIDAAPAIQTSGKIVRNVGRPQKWHGGVVTPAQ